MQVIFIICEWEIYPLANFCELEFAGGLPSVVMEEISLTVD